MNAVPASELKIRALIDAAEKAHAEGNPAQASQLLSLASIESPESPTVLQACGVQALRNGDAAGARALFERAIAYEPNPRVYLNLASALRNLGDADAEMQALQHALDLDPYFYLALFQKASLLESQGKAKLAAGAYHAALSCLKPGAPLPTSLQALVGHAQARIRENSLALESWLEERLRSARTEHAAESLERVDECLAVYFGRKRVFVQQPTMTHFPRLPAISFYERRDFPWLPAVEAATADIQRELTQLLADSRAGFAPYVAYAKDVPLNQWQELNHSERWSALFLFKDGTRNEAIIERCPATVRALAATPFVNIPDRAPTAFFSRLQPHTRIPPHTGVTNTRLTVHLPLVVPPNCGFRVGSHIREWQIGTALIFDDTIEHEAYNDSDQERIILIFDIWNPLLTAAERELMTIATVGISEFYQD